MWKPGQILWALGFDYKINQVKIRGGPIDRDEAPDAYYDVYKYILTFQQKKLKANIFDFNRTIEEKNDILHLNVFIEKDIESIILHNYGKVKEIIEINSKTYSDKSISKTYSFILNNKEYKIAFAMIKNPNNANKSYINYLKLD